MDTTFSWLDSWRLSPLALSMLLPLCDPPAEARGLTDPAIAAAKMVAHWLGFAPALLIGGSTEILPSAPTGTRHSATRWRRPIAARPS